MSAPLPRCDALLSASAGAYVPTCLLTVVRVVIQYDFTDTALHTQSEGHPLPVAVYEVTIGCIIVLPLKLMQTRAHTHIHTDTHSSAFGRVFL